MQTSPEEYMKSGRLFDWSAIWRRLTTTRYTMRLEDEVERLQAENRALMNSMLVRAGVQPIDTPKPVPRPGRSMSRYQRQQQIERNFLAGQQKSSA